MSKLLKALLISAYSSLIIQYIRTLIIINEEIIEIDYLFRTPGTMKKMERELKKLRKTHEMAPNMTSNMNFVSPERLPTDLKYILKWTQVFPHYTSITKNGQQAFIEQNCTHYNCFLTNDKSLLIDLRHFDAILFNVETNWDYHPVLRNKHQKYIFVASESADNYPVCEPYYDNYYNFTWTYKLTSDIRWSYINIFDKNGTFVGPKVDMIWKDPMDPIPEEVKAKLANKKKAAAWFVSHCNAKSNREIIAKQLVTEFTKFGLKLDIYGWCGKLTCPRDRIEECLDLLEKEYFFYLAFENSICEDYVTEKILYPLLHYAVPIVFGGANYSRFLPPGSYINAGTEDAKTIAMRVSEAINKSEVYQNYFRWHNHYEYRESPEIGDFCTLCKVMNEKGMSHNVVKNFRRWWNTDDNNTCREYFKG